MTNLTKRPTLLLISLLLAFSAAMAILSPGFFEVDELSHFLKSREMLHDWTQLLDIWGRPACTLLFGLAAALGNLFHQPLIAARLLAVLLTALTARGTVSLYNSLLPHLPTTDTPHFTRHADAWLWILLYAQPFFLLNSFTVMTEILLACSWVWAATLLLQSKPKTAVLLLGLGGLARPEGWFAISAIPLLLPLWNYLVSPPQKPRPPLHSLLLISLISLLPPLAWWLLGAFAYHNWRWMIDFFPWQTHSQYGTTGLFFLASSLAALALWMWIPVIIGALRIRHKSLPLLILVLPTAAFFLLHATLGTLGLMGALSLPRYFICVSPFLAILTLLGLQSLSTRIHNPRYSRWLRKTVVFAALFPATLLFLANQLPTPKTTDTRQLDVAIAAFKIHQQNIPQTQWSEQLIANHPYVFYALNIRMDTPFHDRIFNPDLLRTAPLGTKLITDSVLWEKENRPTAQDLLAWGYEPDPAVAIAVMQVPIALDITTFSITRKPPTMTVGLWIKQR